MKLVNIEQGSQEWFEVRKLKMTASHASAIATAGVGLNTYIIDMIAEYYSYAEKEEISNINIDRGNELEAQARCAYEFETGNEVSQIGFIIYNDYVGVSPDGLVGDDGLMEIKCPSDKEHMRFVLTNKIQPKYIAQMQMQMLVSGRKWCDFVSYSENFDKSIHIIRVEADEDMFEKIDEGLKKGEGLIKQYLDKLNNK